MKIKQKMFSAIGALTIFAPVAAVVSCDKTSSHYDVGFVTGGDGTIQDGYFGPMYKAVQAEATTEKLAAGSVDVKSGGGEAGQKTATENLIDQGAKVIFQPGFENSKSILDNAVKYPDVKFFGVSYTPYVTATKGFTEKVVANIDANLEKIKNQKNLGLMHFKMQESGFVLGYLGAAQYFKDHPNTDLKYSSYSTKAYQDITAMLDGYTAGVEQFGIHQFHDKTESAKHIHKIAPLATGKYFTDVTVEKPEFAATNQSVADYIKNQGVGLFMVGDPNSLATFNDTGISLVSDGGEYNEFQNVKVASNKAWENVFGNALKAATANDNTFENEYQKKLHLSSIDNKELTIFKKSLTDDQYQEATDALKTWEDSLRQDSSNIYTKKDDKGNETDPNTSGGLEWISSLLG